MKLPRKITIAGHSIEIRYKRGLVYQGSECYGLWDPNKHIIYLLYGMTETQKMEILLHEIIHAVSDIHLLKLSEKVVKLLGLELLATIRNNKLNYLRGTKK